MSVKALFRKEWKQSKILLFIISLSFVFIYPIRAALGLEEWRKRVGDVEYFMPEHEVPSILGTNIFGMIILILLVLLAILFIGVERNTRRHDFAFALPFKRRTMFFVKWFIGVAVVTVVMFITFTIAYLLISTSEFGIYIGQDEHSYLSFFLTPWLSYLATYTFTLFIGTFTGEMVSQLALTFIFTIFPIGIISLIYTFLAVHTIGSVYYLNLFSLRHIVWPYYIVASPHEVYLWIPAVATILFLIIGAWLYERNPSEHNGEFLLFKSLEPFFRIGIIVCFGLLGGMIVSSLVPYSLGSGTRVLFYWIGVVIFVLLSYLLTKRLFTMNITVKGK